MALFVLKQLKLYQPFFIEKVLKVLEKYVVNLIGWGEPLKSDPTHTISPDELGEQIISQFITSIDSKDIVRIDYNPALLSRNDEKQESLATSLKNLKVQLSRQRTKGL